MIDPPFPAASMCGTAAFMVCQTPVRLMSIIVCHWSSDISQNRLQLQIPALATTTSKRPPNARRLRRAPPTSRDIPHVHDPREDLPAFARHQVDRLREVLFGRGRVADIGGTSAATSIAMIEALRVRAGRRGYALARARPP